MGKIINMIWLSIYSIFEFNFYKSSRILKKELTREKSSEIELYINDNFVPQGMCAIGEYILVTMYDCTHQLNSKACVINNNEIIHTAILDNKAHVGGICYDKTHDNIWITDRSGTISCYDYKDILIKNKVEAKYKKVKIPGLINISNYNAVGYIAYFDNKLYMGNYSIGKQSKLVSYGLNQDGSINFNTKEETRSFAFVQGITLKKEESRVIAFISSSYGINKSLIRVIDYETKKVLHKVKMPPMLEQITFDADGNLLALFESNAKIYKKYHFKTSDINRYIINRL